MDNKKRLQSTLIVLYWVILLLVFDSFWNDGMHQLLHWMSESNSPTISHLSYLHMSYHGYINTDYQINHQYLFHQQLFDNLLKNTLLSSIYFYPLLQMKNNISTHLRMALMIIVMIYFCRVTTTLMNPVGDIVNLKATSKGRKLLQRMEKEGYRQFYTHRIFPNKWTRSYHIAHPNEAHNSFLDISNLI